MHRVANIAVDRWHFPMLNDYSRNENFLSALGEICRSYKRGSGVRILDIGAGTGLLSLYAQDAGASAKIYLQVIACEASAPMAEIARIIVSKNKELNLNKCNKSEVDDTVKYKEINLIEKLSTHISKNEIKKGSIDILVTETFDAGLLGEHVLETLDHAFKNFLSEKCTIIPCRASVYIVPIECQAIYQKTRMIYTDAGLISFDGLNITNKQLDDEPYTSERLNAVPGGFTYLSNSCGEKLIDINFENSNQIEEYLRNGRTFHRRIQCRLKKDTTSQLHAVALWFELYLLDGKCENDMKITTKPPTKEQINNKNCWDQAIFPIQQPMQIKSGDELDIKVNLKGHFSLQSCEKIQGSNLEKTTATKAEIFLKFPAHTIIQLNDRQLQNCYQCLVDNITSSMRQQERWKSKRKIDILDLTETCVLSLQLLKLNMLNKITVACIDCDNSPDDTSALPLATRIRYVSELALNNNLKVQNIDCVTSLENAPNNSYDLVLMDFVEPCGKLNYESIRNISM